MGWLILLVVVAFFAFGFGSTVREKVEDRKRKRMLELREKLLTDLDKTFKGGFLKGRQWLAEFIAEAEATVDADKLSELKGRYRPARKAAAVVSEIRREKREMKARLKFVEYQLKSYEEYFPFLEEYRDVILDERIPLTSDGDNVNTLEESDPVLQLLSREEYDRLSVSERNQRALDSYVNRSKSNWEIGRMYERYLGFQAESGGRRVTFNGAVSGYADFGRDLICRKGTVVEIIQAKCWSHTKTIHEKHVFQLYGTCVHYRLENPGVEVHPILTTTTQLSEAAQIVAKALLVRVENVPLEKRYPMIKCNINPHTKERIYHLPLRPAI
jgi:hypothetical protein